MSHIWLNGFTVQASLTQTEWVHERVCEQSLTLHVLYEPHVGVTHSRFSVTRPQPSVSTSEPAGVLSQVPLPQRCSVTDLLREPPLLQKEA